MKLNFTQRLSLGMVPLLLLAGCTTVPSGPSIMSLPGSGKNFDEFRADDMTCRQYAQMQSSNDPNQAGVDAGLRSAAVGTVVGAAAGALINGHQGAGVGAGSGLIVGSMAGTGAANSSTYGMQRAYDNAYIQCMYAKGNQVPIAGNLQSNPRPAPAWGGGTSYPPSAGYVQNPSTRNTPPPPPNAPPPAR